MQMAGGQMNDGAVDCGPAASGPTNQQKGMESDAKKSRGGVRVTTNMERFLKAITPSVPAHFTSKMTMRESSCAVEYEPHFMLGEVWESLKEWSAFGAAVPLLLNHRHPSVQYYVPFLSAIQIFVHPSTFHALSCRQKAQENEAKRTVNHSKGQQTADLSPKMENLSVKDQQTAAKEGSFGNAGVSATAQGCLLFQYVEHESPFVRDPLFRKISDLSVDFPVLTNLRSSDMLSSSWFSVAWYPIYRIPTGPAMRDLEACFLTYHSLSTPSALGGVSGSAPAAVTYPDGIDGVPKIALPSFGLSSYKYRGDMWTCDSGSGQQMVNNLSEAVTNWLKALQVHHPDHSFFASRR